MAWTQFEFAIARNRAIEENSRDKLIADLRELIADLRAREEAYKRIILTLCEGYSQPLYIQQVIQPVLQSIIQQVQVTG